MTTAPLKHIFTQERPLLGMVLRTADPAFAEVVADAGYDFAWIDMEHSTLSFKEVEGLIVALKNSNCISLVRVATNNANSIGQALDLGASIVNVPHVATVDDARRAVCAAKYYPLGRRGFTGCTRPLGHGALPLNADTMKTCNENNMLMVQIESQLGMENVRGIADVEGIDIVFLGMGDLSQALGVPGDFQHPKCIAAQDAFAMAVVASGKIAAGLTTNDETAKRFAQLGFKMISCGVDLPLFREALTQRLKMFHASI